MPGSLHMSYILLIFNIKFYMDWIIVKINGLPLLGHFFHFIFFSYVQ